MGKHNTKRGGHTRRTDAALRDLEALKQQFDAWQAKHWPVCLSPDLDDAVDRTVSALSALGRGVILAELDGD